MVKVSINGKSKRLIQSNQLERVDNHCSLIMSTLCLLTKGYTIHIKGEILKGEKGTFSVRLNEIRNETKKSESKEIPKDMLDGLHRKLSYLGYTYIGHKYIRDFLR